MMGRIRLPLLLLLLLILSTQKASSFIVVQKIQQCSTTTQSSSWMNTNGEDTSRTGRISWGAPSSNNAKPRPAIISAFQRALLAASAAPLLTHQEELPLPTQLLISQRARTILSFCATYLDHKKATHNWDIDLYASGGYVRDLLLGRVSSDLDLSLGLSRCTDPNVTVLAIAKDMEIYCQEQQQQHSNSSTTSSAAAIHTGIQSVHVTSRLSDTTANANVDAALVQMVLTGGEVVCIDLLPTIGAEVYDAYSRVPRRNQRGTSEEDSLRRDLTIGSMLIQVGTREREKKLRKKRRRGFFRPKQLFGSRQEQQSSPADNLRFVLLDYFGAIEDISTRSLRSPLPLNMSLGQVWEVFSTTNATTTSSLLKGDVQLAQSLGLDPSSSSYPTATKLQTLWWAKMLREDPYRILRTLRFSATLSFDIDPSFWLAVSFAVQPGCFDTKVSSTRKLTELRKVIGDGGDVRGGAMRLLNFFRTVLFPPRIIHDRSALPNSFFGTHLLEGAGKGAPYGMDIARMDYIQARKLVAQLPPNLSVDEIMGAVLGLTFLSCDSPNAKDDNKDNIRRDMHTTVQDTVARLDRTLQLIDRACKGLQTPNSVAKAARDPLLLARRLLEPLPVTSLHALFAASVAWSTPTVPVSMQDRAQQFATMMRLWDLFQLAAAADDDVDQSLAQPLASSIKRRSPTADSGWVLGILEAASTDAGNSIGGGNRGTSAGQEAPELVQYLEANVRQLLLLQNQRRVLAANRRQRHVQQEKTIREGGGNMKMIGKAVAGLPEVPPHLRSQLMSALQLLLQLRGDVPILETPEDLRRYLEGDCDGLLTKLAEEWWVEGIPQQGNLRPEYCKQK